MIGSGIATCIARRTVPWAVRWLSRAINAARLRRLPSHKARIRRSRDVLRTLRQFKGEAAAARTFGYLRRVDPLVYEEVVLSALEDAGALVLRNRRYSGDGGVDGRCWIPAWQTGLHAVQSKRYGSCVDPAHVAALGKVVRERQWAGGLFVHCGRTGPMSYMALRDARVVVVSGDRLLSLLLDRKLPPAAPLKGVFEQRESITLAPDARPGKLRDATPVREP